MQAGDLILDIKTGMFGMLIERDWETDIGTPFDWLVLYFDGTSGGIDERDIDEVNPWKWQEFAA